MAQNITWHKKSQITSCTGQAMASKDRSLLSKARYGKFAELWNKKDSIVDPAYRDSKGNTFLHYIAGGKQCSERDNLLAFFLSGNVDVNTVNKKGLAPVHFAARSNNPAVIEALKEHGADISILDASGAHILHLASLSGAAQVVQFLLSLGVPPDLKDGDGLTALYHSVISLDLPCFQSLLEAQPALATQCDNEGAAPIHIAAQVGFADIIPVLVAHGADPSAKNESLASPLHKAASSGEVASIKILCKLGADINACDDHNNTPLHIAARRGHVTCVLYLVKNGAVIDPQNNRGRTPLRLAAMKSQQDCVLTLMNLGADKALMHSDPSKGRNKSGSSLESKKKSSSAVKVLTLKKREFQLEFENVSTEEDGTGEALTPRKTGPPVPPRIKAADVFTAPDGSQDISSSSSDSEVLDDVDLDDIIGEDSDELEGIEVVSREPSKTLSAQTLMHMEVKSSKSLPVDRRSSMVASSIRQRSAPGSIQSLGNAWDDSDSEGSDADDLDMSSYDRWGFLKDSEEAQSSKDPSKSKKQEDRNSLKWDKYIRKMAMTGAFDDPKLDNLILSGLPNPIRGFAWKTFSGGVLLERENRGLYSELVKKSVGTELAVQIEKDISRTYRNHVLFRKRKGAGQRSLMMMLRAYSAHHPEVGYCQGMSATAALLIMYMVEEDAFWTFSSLFAQRSGMYLMGEMLFETFYTHESLLRLFNPKLHEHFQAQNVESSMYTTRWFLQVFLGCLPFETILRIWDVFTCRGYYVVFQFAQCILKVLTKELLKLNFEKLVGFLLNGLMNHPDMSANTIMAVYRKLSKKITRKSIEGIQSTFVMGEKKTTKDLRRSMRKARDSQ